MNKVRVNQLLPDKEDLEGGTDRSFYLEKQQIQALETLADEKDTSASEVLRDLLDDALD